MKIKLEKSNVPNRLLNTELSWQCIRNINNKVGEEVSITCRATV